MTIFNTIERKIYFYYVEFKDDKKPLNYNEVFSEINKLAYDENGRYLKIEEGKYWSIIVDSLKQIRGRMGVIRKSDLPLLEEVGEIQPLIIPENAGLFEPMHFVCFPNNIIGFEYNHYGPRPSSLAYYISKILENPVTDFEILPLIEPDIQNTLNRIGDIRLFKIKVNRNMTELLKDLDDNLYNALSSLKNTSNAEEFEIVLKSKSRSKKDLNLKFIKRLFKFLKTPNLIDIDTLKLKARDKFTNRIIEFDLLQELLLSKKTVAKLNKNSRAVDSNSMYKAIENSYFELKDSIKSIIEGGIESVKEI